VLQEARKQGAAGWCTCCRCTCCRCTCCRRRASQGRLAAEAALGPGCGCSNSGRRLAGTLHPYLAGRRCGRRASGPQAQCSGQRCWAAPPLHRRSGQGWEVCVAPRAVRWSSAPSSCTRGVKAGRIQLRRQQQHPH